MTAVAKGLVLGLAAAAQRNRRAARKAERITLRIVDGKIAFYADGAIIVHGNFRISHYGDGSRVGGSRVCYFLGGFGLSAGLSSTAVSPNVMFVWALNCL
jgi:hypothetical protein